MINFKADIDAVARQYQPICTALMLKQGSKNNDTQNHKETKMLGRNNTSR